MTGRGALGTIGGALEIVQNGRECREWQRDVENDGGARMTGRALRTIKGRAE